MHCLKIKTSKWVTMLDLRTSRIPLARNEQSRKTKNDVIKESHVVKTMFRMVISIKNPPNMFQGEPTGRTLSDDSGREEKN